MEYIRRNGPLNLGTRMEQGFALIAMMVNRSVGGKSQLSDFLPDRTEQDMAGDGENASAQDAFMLLKGLARPEGKAA